MLAREEVEAALVPVIEYQRIPDLLVVPGVCVGSHERVRSVILITRTEDLKRVHSVALDASSRTSAALVSIIFREFYNIEPEWIVRAPNPARMLEEADAALIIGDPAMSFSDENLRVYDLASLWREKTGLGFVFAMWMTHEKFAGRVRAIDFAGARDEGLAHASEIAAQYEKEIGLPQAELRSYLRENIAYVLDESLQAGLDLYFKLAYRHGIVPAVHTLKFLDVR